MEISITDNAFHLLSKAQIKLFAAERKEERSRSSVITISFEILSINIFFC